MNIKYASAVERAQLAPDTFAPTTGDDLAGLEVGDFVKVCIEEFNGERHGERFWVEVTAIDGGMIYGTVANHLERVPLNHGTPIEFGKGNVFAVAGKESAQEAPPPPNLVLTKDDVWLLVDTAVRGSVAGRGDEFKAILQRMSDAVGYEPPSSVSQSNTGETTP